MSDTPPRKGLTRRQTALYWLAVALYVGTISGVYFADLLGDLPAARTILLIGSAIGLLAFVVGAVLLVRNARS